MLSLQEMFVDNGWNTRYIAYAVRLLRLWF